MRHSAQLSVNITVAPGYFPACCNWSASCLPLSEGAWESFSGLAGRPNLRQAKKKKVKDSNSRPLPFQRETAWTVFQINSFCAGLSEPCDALRSQVRLSKCFLSQYICPQREPARTTDLRSACLPAGQSLTSPIRHRLSDKHLGRSGG